jgi:hypothetical protein
VHALAEDIEAERQIGGTLISTTYSILGSPTPFLTFLFPSGNDSQCKRSGCSIFSVSKSLHRFKRYWMITAKAARPPKRWSRPWSKDSDLLLLLSGKRVEGRATIEPAVKWQELQRP